MTDLYENRRRTWILTLKGHGRDPTLKGHDDGTWCPRSSAAVAAPVIPDLQLPTRCGGYPDGRYGRRRLGRCGARAQATVFLWLRDDVSSRRGAQGSRVVVIVSWVSIGSDRPLLTLAVRLDATVVR